MKRRTALLTCAAVASAVALGSLFGGVFTESRSAGASAVPAPRLDVESALSGFGRGNGTAGTVAKLEAELRSASRDPDRLVVLGLAYQIRWRETGDPGFLSRSERALGDALAARPNDADRDPWPGPPSPDPPRLSQRARAGTRGTEPRPGVEPAVRRHRRRARRARAVYPRRSPRSSAWSRSSRRLPRTLASPTPGS